jgi:NhaP-type Na+/H+ or K+/H+ antiporter
MVILLAFALTLLVAALVSELAERSVLSTAVLFLASGFLLGRDVLNFIPLGPDDPLLSRFTEVALFSVLFTEGMRTGIRDLAAAWRLPGRALIVGLPITLAITACLAHYVAGLPWMESILVGAILSPTDPVFAATLIGREEVPLRLRHLLNVESGVNDGLALPVVVVMLALISASEPQPAVIAWELALGIALGVVVPWIVLRLERSRFFQATDHYRPLTAFAIGLVVFSVAHLTHANEFLAAFAAGVTVASLGPEARVAFAQFGDLVTEILKLAAILLVGALLSPSFLGDVPWPGYLFAALVLVAVRPAALAIALAGSGLSGREWVAAAWFGPKGFASIFYGLLVLRAQIGRADEIFHLVAVAVGLSILAHSSTDVPVARWFRSTERADAAHAQG